MNETGQLDLLAPLSTPGLPAQSDLVEDQPCMHPPVRQLTVLPGETFEDIFQRGENDG